MNMLSKLSDFVFKNRWLLILIFIANIIGTLYGFYYYQQQFTETPAYLWIFIPDSPIYTLLFAAVIGLYLLRSKLPKFWSALAFVGLVKVGIWTLLVILLYSSYFLSPANFQWYIVLFALHIGMIAEAVVVLPRLKIETKHVFVIVAWFLLNDVMDYVVATVPRSDVVMQSPLLFNALFLESVIVTLALGFLLYRNKQKRGS